jgi:hypothetical protein
VKSPWNTAFSRMCAMSSSRAPVTGPAYEDPWVRFEALSDPPVP